MATVEPTEIVCAIAFIYYRDAFASKAPRQMSAEAVRWYRDLLTNVLGERGKAIDVKR